MPARLAYGALLDALGDRADAVAKELEVYAGDEPPPGFTLGVEVEGILREADARGFERFHLTGYSAGGASALAFAAAHGERLLSLALLEPAWAGNERTPEEEALNREFAKLEQLPPGERMDAFTRLQLAPGVEPPPPGPATRFPVPAPAWDDDLTFVRAFDQGHLDPDALRRFDRPVYFALGGRSNPDYFAQIARRLDALFPDFTLEVFPERHHFDPPHRVEPERVAASLLALWERAEAA